MSFVKDLLKNKSFYLSLIFLAIGFYAGFYWQNIQTKPAIQNNQTNASSEFHAGGYQFINPLYECNTGENYGTEKLVSIEKDVQNYIHQVTDTGPTNHVGVYFRDLNNGPWFGINEHDDFTPSSLLKTPVMMAYFKEAESNPSILSKKIKYLEDPPGLIPQDFPPKDALEKGKTYTVEELIERMIASSDNVALRLLEENIDNAKIDKVTIDLGITTATNSTPDDFMDVQEYSTLFRVLYYATYLNKDYSEKALQILSDSEFKQGLVAAVPKNIPVAHKFGERHLDNGINQLHDCGIVYYPNRPYLVCVMTRGTDFNDLAITIREVSSKIYQEFSRKYPKG